MRRFTAVSVIEINELQISICVKRELTGNDLSGNIWLLGYRLGKRGSEPVRQKKKEGRKPEIQSLSIGKLSRFFGWIGLFLCYLAVGTAYADDYFDRITVASNGRLTRFDHDRIRVYADTIPFEVRGYEEALSRSLSRWEKGTQGKLQFQLTPDAAAADIRIKWAYQQNRGRNDEYIGEAMLIRGAEGFHVEIEVSLRDRTSLKPHSPEIVEAALLHEVGHAIGLWGHSDDPNDVMYFAATAKAPTARDIVTWTKVSETPVDVPFHEHALRVLQAEVEEDRTIASNHYLIGMIYADLGDYHLAINAFQRSTGDRATTRRFIGADCSDLPAEGNIRSSNQKLHTGVANSTFSRSVWRVRNALVASE